MTRPGTRRITRSINMKGQSKGHRGPSDSPPLLIVPGHDSMAFTGNNAHLWVLEPWPVQWVFSTASHTTASQSSVPVTAYSIRLTCCGKEGDVSPDYASCGEKATRPGRPELAVKALSKRNVEKRVGRCLHQPGHLVSA